ncbi:YciI family protein [Rhizobium deserti]|uniref:YciI family protein n=1 Tax=Rhizobium deserti TaxID=2547961 RepID=UPI001387076E|nr:YciI family protein [Rhizobium deserti]
MPYLITAKDHPEKRRKAKASVGIKLLASGALLSDDGKAFVGGASLLDTDDEEEARRFEAEDPYATAGIRAEVTISSLAAEVVARPVES